MSEVKRFIVYCPPKYKGSHTGPTELSKPVEAVRAADHDRIVAGLQAQIEQLTNEGAAYAKNLRGKHELAGATYERLVAKLAEQDAVIEQRNGECSWKHKEIERLSAEVETLRAELARRPGPGQKLCTSCKTWKPRAEFGASSPGFPAKDGLQVACVDCVAKNPAYFTKLPNGQLEMHAKAQEAGNEQNP